MKLRQMIMAYIMDKDYEPLTKEELAEVFEFNSKDTKVFYEILKDLEREGRLRLSKRDRIMPGKALALTGTISSTDRGFAFFVPDDGTEDVFIPTGDRKGAMNKDKVEVRITEVGRDGQKSVGKVVKVLERYTHQIVGTYHKRRNFGIVTVDDPKFGSDVYLPKDQIRKLIDGDKVVVALQYAKDDRGPSGTIVERLGQANAPGVDITSIARTFNLPYEFSKKTLKEAKALDDTIHPDGRKDYRGDFTITIDGPDAKDFDDAIGIDKEGDDYVLKVHIADVAHYVKQGSAIDLDAYKRGNSVYLLDRVIPMLPERISNELCSLRPDEEKYTQSVEMRIDPKGRVVSYDFYESIIKSDYRLIYPEVSDFVEGKAHPYDDPLLQEKLTLFAELYRILDEMHTRKGSLDFNFAESEITLDEDGNVLDVKRADRRVANKIIEEFMVLTNETIGQHFAHLKIPFLYRVHEKPSEEKSMALRTILHNFGHTIKGAEIHPMDLQNVLLKIKGKKESPLLYMLILRSLSKAKYQREPDIHFGLATRNYSHFTAPIRRYSDLVVHRIVKRALHHKVESVDPKALDKLDQIAEHVSDTERQADEAERQVSDLKKAEYMERYIGSEFDGIVSSVNSFGFFVQLENTVEGLVHIRELPGYYEFDDAHYTLKKAGSQEMIRLGDPVRVVVAGVDVERRQIDFDLVREGKSNESTGTK